MDSADVTMPNCNRAEGGFITLTKKKCGDARTVNSSENKKIENISYPYVRGLEL